MEGVLFNFYFDFRIEAITSQEVDTTNHNHQGL